MKIRLNNIYCRSDAEIFYINHIHHTVIHLTAKTKEKLIKFLVKELNLCCS